jgi:hypothetical protein
MKLPPTTLDVFVVCVRAISTLDLTSRLRVLDLLARWYHHASAP